MNVLDRCERALVDRDERAIKNLLIGEDTRYWMLRQLAMSHVAPHQFMMVDVADIPDALHIAAAYGNIQYVDHCLLTTDIDALSRDVGDTALVFAAYGGLTGYGYGQSDMIAHLLRLGANPNAGRHSALAMAVRWAPDMVDALLAAGANPNGKIGEACPLLVAARYNPDAVGPLLRAGADPNGNDHGRPIDRAVVLGNTDAVRLLLDAKARPTRYNLVDATKCRHPQIVGPLIAAGAPLDAKDSHGNTALHYAITRSPSAIGTLLAAGADVNAVNYAGVTPRKLAEHYPVIRRKYAELA